MTTTSKPAAMTPLRALTIGLNAALLAEDGVAAAAIGRDRVSAAVLAAGLAQSAIANLPEGWRLVDAGKVATDEEQVRGELKEIEQRLREIDGTQRLLLAFRILSDGHAKNLGEAGRIAHDWGRVRELYPDMSEKP
jgi:hypothetical protein